MLKINYEEFVVLKELFLLIKLRFRKIFNNGGKKEGKILIINSSIIGDFLVSLPALSYFLKKNKIKADIIVAPNLKSLAERIRGIEKVFVSNSLYQRKIEKGSEKIEIPDDYKEVIVIRIGSEGYKALKKLNPSVIKIPNAAFFRFGNDVIKNFLFKKKIQNIKNLFFEILEIKKPRSEVAFKDIFEFKNSDYEKINKIPELRENDYKKIIIHTGSGWKEKLWKNIKWVELLKKINSTGKFKFFFVGGAEEKKSFDYIKKNLNFKMYSLINKIDLKELLLVMKKCNYFIGVDSGPRNMAHLTDLRSITIAGPVLQHFMSSDKRDIVLSKSDVRTINLFYFGKNNINKITSNEVFDAFKKLQLVSEK